jgi:hypothetical protein
MAGPEFYTERPQPSRLGLAPAYPSNMALSATMREWIIGVAINLG